MYKLSYGEYLLNELVKKNSTGTKLYIMYDIACMLKKHLQECHAESLTDIYIVYKRILVLSSQTYYSQPIKSRPLKKYPHLLFHCFIHMGTRLNARYFSIIILLCCSCNHIL